jgi:hypothetical protein
MEEKSLENLSGVVNYPVYELSTKTLNSLKAATTTVTTTSPPWDIIGEGSTAPSWVESEPTPQNLAEGRTIVSRALSQLSRAVSQDTGERLELFYRIYPDKVCLMCDDGGKFEVTLASEKIYLSRSEEYLFSLRERESNIDSALINLTELIMSCGIMTLLSNAGINVQNL